MNNDHDRVTSFEWYRT